MSGGAEDTKPVFERLNAALLDGTSDVPAELAALASNSDSYALTLKCARQLFRLAEYTRLEPLLDNACTRHPNSIDLALLQVDTTAHNGPAPKLSQSLDRLARLTRETGRKRTPAATRLARHDRSDEALALLQAPGTAPEARISDAITLIELTDQTGEPDPGSHLLNSLAKAHPTNPSVQRATIRRAAFYQGSPGALKALASIQNPDPSLLPTTLHELLQLGATNAATRLVTDHGPEPFGWPLHLRLALLTNQPDEAARIFHREPASRPLTDWSERDFALCLQIALASDQPPAPEILSAAPRLYPASPRLALLKAQLAFSTGNWADAVSQLRAASSQNPASPPHRLALATLLTQTGDYEAAATELAALPETEPVLLRRLRLARACGDLAAVYDLQTRLQGFSHAAREKAAIAGIEALLLEGKPQQAMAEMNQATETWPHSADLLMLAGKISFLEGDLPRAAAYRATRAALPDADQEGLDTHDLVLREAAREPNQTNPATWMRHLYRRLKDGGIALPKIAPDPGIPPVLITYWEGETCKAIGHIANAWQRILPDFDHHTFDRASATAWLTAHNHPDLAAAIQKAEAPASAADIFRLAYLAENGGLYTDTDEFPRVPIEDWLKDSTLLLTAEKGHFTVANSFIACAPGHPVIRDALARLKARSVNLKGGLETWMETGPGLMTEALGNYLSHTPKPAGLRLLKPQEYAARVSTTLNLPHKIRGIHWRSQTD